MITEIIIQKKWQSRKLKEIAKIVTKGSTPTSYGFNFLDKGINFIKIENIRNGKIDLDSISQFISSEAHDFQKRSQLEEGDLLFSIAGTIGKICKVTKKDLPANTNQALAIIRGTEEILLPEFLEYQFQSHLSTAVKSKARGGAMNNISLDDLKNMIIKIPSKQEQELIVAEIEKEFTRLDSAIESLQTIKKKLEVYRNSILKSAFEGKLIEFTNKQSDLLKNMAQIKGGKRLPKGKKLSDEKTPYPYIRVTDFENYSINLNDLKYISAEIQKEISRYTISKEDVFISIAGTIGRVGIIPDELQGANLTENAAKITEINNIIPKYLMYYLTAPQFRHIIKLSTKATSQPKLALYRIGEFNINYPESLEEQEKVVAEIESQFSIIEKLEQTIDASIIKAETLRKSILKSAFEGKLVEVKNA